MDGARGGAFACAGFTSDEEGKVCGCSTSDLVVNPLQGGAGTDEGIDEFVPGCEPVFSCNDKLGIAQGEVGRRLHTR